MAKKKTAVKKSVKVYKVYYTKRVGGVGSVLVKAASPGNALANAKNHVRTGSKFRNPVLQKTNTYKKPRKQGFAGGN